MTLSNEPLNVVILPDDAVNREAIKLSQKFSKQFDTYFTLDGKTLYSHVTLYQTTFPSKNYGKIIQAIKNIVNGIRQFEVTLNGFSLSMSSFVSWNCVITKELRILHEKVVTSLNPLHGQTPSFYRGLQFSESQMKSIENYGYPSTFNLYSPHITITRIKDETKAELVKRELIQNEMNFKVSAIYLGRLGDHGTVTEILEEFPLK